MTLFVVLGLCRRIDGYGMVLYIVVYVAIMAWWRGSRIDSTAKSGCTGTGTYKTDYIMLLYQNVSIAV